MVATRATRFRMWIDSLTEAYPATGASLMGPSTPGRVTIHDPWIRHTL
jgi:hypothetical protein